jgi:predicted alpha/beta superfamily hydrolase
MIRRILLAALMFGSAASLPCRAESIPIGERLTLPSMTMGEERTILVSLPESYGWSAQKYPVLYLTDAQWQFEQTRASAAFLARNGMMPEIIIIGVTSTDRTSDLYATRADFKDRDRIILFPASGHADRFLDFMEKELIPWSDAKYRTAPLRILAGHSAGGNFALHVMRVKPTLFQTIIAASPWLAWDERNELKQLLPFLASSDVRARTLFFTSADEGPEMKTNIEALTLALHARKDAFLRWDSVRYPNESHDSAVLKSYYDAFRMIFAGWSYPRDPESGLLAGSLDDLKSYYAKLGERLGFPLVPPEATVNELGYQFLQTGRLDDSLTVFRFNRDLNPTSANVWDSLGDALDHSGKMDDALASYRKAVSLAEANGDPNISEFRKHVARLRAQPKSD